MSEIPEKGKAPGESAFESDSSRVELYRPQSILRTTEWGLLTITALVSSFAFPPYFLAVLWLAFLNAGGLLWVTHLSEKGRLRLREFEREFSQGHLMEEQGKIVEAIAYYKSLIPHYQEFPKIAEIASRRIEYLKAQLPSKVSRKTKAKTPKTRRTRRG